MPIRILIAGYIFTLLAAMLGCLIIARTRHASRGTWWTMGGLASALVGLLLFSGIQVIPGFFTIVLANEAMLLAFVLLHQAAASVLASPRRHIGLGLLLLIVQFVLFVHFTYGAPNMQARVGVRSSTIFVQVLLTTILLFRQGDHSFQYASRTAGGVFAFFALLQCSQFFANLVRPPSPDRLHPAPVLAFFYIFNFMVGMGCWFAIVWLSICEQRHDLQIMATTDGLSGLMNRTSFDEILQHELRHSERRRRPLALLLVDLDHFKEVNDLYGHQAGDEVIRQVSRLLSASVRPTDSVARYGGEEFAIVLKNMKFEEAEVIAERLRLQIESMPRLPDGLRITASIGIAMRQASDTTEALFKRSDEALYLSKRLGRNRVSAVEYAYGET